MPAALATRQTVRRLDREPRESGGRGLAAVGACGVRTKPKMPRGWSWPLTATEREERLAGAAYVRWERGTLRSYRGAISCSERAGCQGRWCLSLCSPFGLSRVGIGKRYEPSSTIRWLTPLLRGWPGCHNGRRRGSRSGSTRTGPGCRPRRLRPPERRRSHPALWAGRRCCSSVNRS